MDGMKHLLAYIQSWLNVGESFIRQRCSIWEDVQYPPNNSPPYPKYSKYSIMKASNENQLELIGMNKIARTKNEEKTEAMGENGAVQKWKRYILLGYAEMRKSIDVLKNKTIKQCSVITFACAGVDIQLKTELHKITPISLTIHSKYSIIKS